MNGRTAFDRQVNACLSSWASNCSSALAAPARRRIKDALAERDGQTLIELCSRLAADAKPALTRQAISQRLDMLERSSLVRTRREGRYKSRRLDSRHFGPSSNGGHVRKAMRGSDDSRVTSVHVDGQSKALAF